MCIFTSVPIWRLISGSAVFPAPTFYYTSPARPRKRNHRDDWLVVLRLGAWAPGTHISSLLITTQYHIKKDIE